VIRYIIYGGEKVKEGGEGGENSVCEKGKIERKKKTEEFKKKARG
jgi:hypothetical protein